MKSLEPIACMQSYDGHLILGHGSFESHPEAPSSGVAFYVNDFARSDPAPWKIPATVLKGKEAEEWLSRHALDQRLKIDWQTLSPGEFPAVFGEILNAIRHGKIQKSVPVAVERGQVEQGELTELLGHLAGRPREFCPYGWVSEKESFCGLTPEVLFSLRKGRLHTMALAGTARAEDAEVFVWDEKEICEHEFVAETLVSKLSDLGMVKRGEREVLHLGSLVHFHTPIEVGMYNDYSLEMLIAKLHPTPALGPLPRSEATLQQLYDWRERVRCPPYFGAPFGVLEEGVFHSVVAIRGLHWQGSEITVPSGCGVIEASRLTNEWQELALKRRAVKRMFGVEEG